MTTKSRFLKFFRVLEKTLTTLFWILIMFGFDLPFVAILTIAAAVIHEVGHVIAILFLDICATMPVGRFFGFRITLKALSGYKKEIIILLAGPLSNLLVALISFPIGRISSYLYYFALVNFLTGISSLMPIKGYDGYSLLRLLTEGFGKYPLTRAIERVSFVLCSLFTLLSLFLMYYYDTGYWIYGVFIAILLTEIGENLKQTFSKN